VNGARQIALDLGESCDADQEHMAPDERPGERRLILTVRIRDPILCFVALSARKMRQRRVLGRVPLCAIQPSERPGPRGSRRERAKPSRVGCRR
jgi:hypothetical protein